MHSKKEFLAAFIGALLIITGVVLNEWMVAYLFTYDNNLVTTGRVLVWLFDAALVLVGVLLIARRKNIASRLSFSWKALVFIIGIIVVLAAALEGSARIIDKVAYDGEFNSITVENRKKRGEGEIVPFRIFGPTYYSIGENRARSLMSSHGELYPFMKSDNTVRIAVFGGSTTYQAVDGIHYPFALQEKLQAQYPSKDIEVINVGFPAYATPHSLIVLNNNVLSWDPDIVILSHNINDLTAAYFPDFTPDYANKYSHEFYLYPCRLGSCPLQKLFGWSTLYWLIDQQIKAFSYRKVVGEDYYKRASYGDEPPQEAADAFARNLTTFVNTAKGRGIEVILGTQPFQPDFKLFDRHTRAKPYNDVVVYPLHEELASHHAYYNDIIRKVAKRRGAILVDNAKDFGDDTELFSDFVHYTTAGIIRLSENYKNAIVGRFLIQ